MKSPPALLFEIAQKQQNSGDRDSASNSRGNLSERHQLHPVGGGQDRYIAGSTLAAMTRVHDCRLDRIHVHEPADKEAGRHNGHDRRDDRDDIREVKRRNQLVPRCQRHSDGKQERIGHGGTDEIEHYKTANLELRRNRSGQLGKYRQKQHSNRCRQPEQVKADHAEQIERNGGEPGGRDSADPDLPDAFFRSPFSVPAVIPQRTSDKAPFGGLWK
jgi:hypothetical protein